MDSTRLKPNMCAFVDSAATGPPVRLGFFACFIVTFIKNVLINLDMRLVGSEVSDTSLMGLGVGMLGRAAWEQGL